jgi:hypothetical protein
MTQGPGNSAPLYCPRCGGLLHKPTGSTLYWHASINHPRCDLTNIVETVLKVQLAQSAAPNESAVEQPLQTEPAPASPPTEIVGNSEKPVAEAPGAALPNQE